MTVNLLSISRPWFSLLAEKRKGDRLELRLGTRGSFAKTKVMVYNDLLYDYFHKDWRW